MKTQTKMIRRYSLAHQKLLANLPDWKLAAIKQEPEGRHAQEFSHEVAELAENETEEILLTA